MKMVAAAAMVAVALAGASEAGAGTRWSLIPADVQPEQIVTVGVHSYPGSLDGRGYRAGSPRWAGEWAVRVAGDSEWLVEPHVTGGPEFREVVIPTGAVLEVHWGGDEIFEVDVAGRCAGPDVNLLRYSHPHLEVPAVPLSEGRASVSVTCERPAPLPPVTVAPPPPPVQLLPPTVQLPPDEVAAPVAAPPAPPAPVPAPPAPPAPPVAAVPTLPVTGAASGMLAVVGVALAGAGAAMTLAARKTRR